MKQHEVSGKLDGDYPIHLASGRGPNNCQKRMWAVLLISEDSTSFSWQFRVEIAGECIATQNMASAIQMYDSGVLNPVAGLPR
jgi:hypothetical protein